MGPIIAVTRDHMPTLSGKLRIDPFSAVPLAERVASAYDSLRSEGYSSTDILVLKRFPSGTRQFENELAHALTLETRPNVESVLDHAAAIHAYAAPDTRVLSDYERFELLRTVIDGWNWSHPYLQQAAETESFHRDVGRVLLISSWGGFGDSSSDDPALDAMLQELRAVASQFRTALKDRSTVDQAALIESGTQALSEPSVRSFVSELFDAVLVVDFEEFGELERAYLSALTVDAELYCIGERDASIQRIWNEAGSVVALGEAAGLDCFENPALDRSEFSVTDPELVSQFLAIGHFPNGYLREQPAATTNPTVTAYTLSAATYTEQLEAIANEIEILRDEYGLAYDDFAVLCRDSNQPIHESRSLLRRAGIPTASATVTGLNDDPAVRELVALIDVLATDAETAWDILDARVGGVSQSDLDRIANEPTMSGTIDRWIVDTNLKDRVARAPEIEAYTSYRNIREVRKIATFFDTADFLPGGYDSFRSTLSRAIEYVAPDQYTTDLSVEENGVLVDAIRVAKYDTRPIVFLVDVVEGVYPPATQNLTRLFPTDWVKRSSGYPGVTTPTADTVTESFSSVSDAISDPYDRYYTALARRQLAVGSRVATTRVYFCTAETGNRSFGQHRHPSRFLAALKEHPAVTIEQGYSDPERGDESTALHTETGVARDILKEPWRSFAEIERAASLGESADMRSIRSTLEAVTTVLRDEDVDPRFVDAVHTQISYANGEIGTDE